MAQVAAQPRPFVCPTTWQFDLTLQLPAFSSAEDVHLVFLAIQENEQDNLCILQQNSTAQAGYRVCFFFAVRQKPGHWGQNNLRLIFCRSGCLCGASLWIILWRLRGGCSLCGLYSLDPCSLCGLYTLGPAVDPWSLLAAGCRRCRPRSLSSWS